MRLELRIAAGALAAFTCLGAAQTPPPIQPGGDASARAIATPRYYQISGSGGMKSEDGAKLCLGGDALRKMLEGVREMAKDPKALAQLSKGCTNKTVRDSGSFSMERKCDKASGAPFTSKMRLFGTLDNMHQHLEVTLEGVGPSGRDKNVVSDVTMSYIGQCPANVKPKQILKPDGAIFDALGALSSLKGNKGTGQGGRA